MALLSLLLGGLPGGDPAMALHLRPDKLTRPLGCAYHPLLAFLACLLVAVSPGSSPAQGGRIVYSRQPGFRIPFETDAGERRLQEVQLYVSEDRGQNWQKYTSVQPEQRGFFFR